MIASALLLTACGSSEPTTEDGCPVTRTELEEIFGEAVPKDPPSTEGDMICSFATEGPRGVVFSEPILVIGPYPYGQGGARDLQEMRMGVASGAREERPEWGKGAFSVVPVFNQVPDATLRRTSILIALPNLIVAGSIGELEEATGRRVADRLGEAVTN